MRLWNSATARGNPGLKNLGEFTRPARVAAVVIAITIGLLAYLQVIVLPNPILAVVATTFLLFGLPGFFIASLLLDDKELGLLDQLVLSLAIGMALQAVVASLIMILHASLTTLQYTSVVLTGLLGLVYLRSTRFRHQAPLPFRARVRSVVQRIKQTDTETRLLVVCLICCTGLLLGVFAESTSPWLINSDRWNYMPYIRAYLDLPQLSAVGVYRPASVDSHRMDFIGWPVVIALFTRISGGDLLNIYGAHLPILLYPVSLWCFYLFHKKLFQNRKMALFVTAIYVLYLLATLYVEQAGTPERVGRRFFYGIIEDKGITTFVFFPISLMLVISYLRNPRWRSLILLALFSGAQAATHPVSYFMLGMVVGLFAVVRVCSQLALHLPLKKIAGSLMSSDLSRFVLVLVAISVWVVFSVIQRSAYVGGEESVGAQTYNPALSALGIDYITDKMLSYHVVMLGEQRYVAASTLVQNSGQILAILLAPLLLLVVRKNMAAQFLLGVFALPLILLYVPFTATLLSKIIPVGMLHRINYVLPISQVIGYVVYGLFTFGRAKLARLNISSLGKRALALVPGLLVVILALAWLGDIQRGVAYFEDQKARWSLQPQHERDLRDIVGRLDGELTSKVTVLSEYSVLRRLLSFSAHTTNLVFAQLEPERTRVIDNITRLYDLRFLDTDALRFMQAYEVRYVLWPQSYESAYQFRLLTSTFQLIHENETYALYRMTPDARASTVFAGNTHLLRDEFQQALWDFDRALLEGTDDAGVYYGRGYANFRLGNWQEAVADYQHAVSSSSAPEETIKQVRLGILQEYLPTYLAYSEKYPTPGPVTDDLIVAHDFVDDLPETDDDRNVYRTAFVINGKPEAILFQHPDSEIRYRVSIPKSAVLKFDLALAPDVWDEGMGDGVIFGIDVDDGMHVYPMFLEYLDPKNTPSQRTWNKRSISLKQWEGQEVTLIFKTMGGPKNDINYDWAGWGNPQLVQPIAYNFLEQLSDASIEAEEPSSVSVTTQEIDTLSRDIISVSLPGKLSYLVTLPPRPALYFGIGMDPAVWTQTEGDGATYRVIIETLEGVRYLVYERHLCPQEDPADRHWIDERIDLSRFGSQRVKISFQTDPGPAGEYSLDTGGWSTPVLVAE